MIDNPNLTWDNMEMKPKPMPEITDPDAFWNQIDIKGANECWEWKGTKKSNGYAYYKGRGSHRIAYFLHYGIDPLQLNVCHTCDNPPCCNPIHLWAGTQSDNCKDCVSKGRDNSPFGNQHWSRIKPEIVPQGNNHWTRNEPEKLAKGNKHGSKTHPESILIGENRYNSVLKEQDVRDILRLLVDGNKSQQAIADQFNISRSTVLSIHLGRSWKHIKL